jgi:hypothetical protein
MTIRGVKTAAAGLCALAALAVTATPAFSQGNDSERPVVHSVYARDEGSAIQLRVTYCDNTPPYVARYRHIFRVYDPYGNVVARRTSTRISAIRCVNRGMAWWDHFQNGIYYAQVEVRNLDNGGFIRTQARPFRIS